ncbi:MAG: Rpn family recombination-promoting nuclease/putative transposase [Fibrobacter sp.]|nr:Rpn family recombination-promoting nuclease/putative transposase [Fibrobacter sp.]
MDCKKKKYKPLEELTIRDNFMFVKVFSDEAIAKPFLKALLKIEIERVSVVGEAHQQADPNKKYIRFDVLVKEECNGIGRTFDLEMQMVDTKELPLRARYYQGISDTETMGNTHKYKELKEQYIIFLCPTDIFGQERPIYEFENREKNDPSLTLGDLTYKYFCNFSRYGAVTDESVRDYLKYFATDEASSAATKAISDKVDFYHKDPKTRSDYMTFKDMLEDEREEGREEGRAEACKELAKGFRDAGISLEVIAKQTGLTPEEIKAL